MGNMRLLCLTMTKHYSMLESLYESHNNGNSSLCDETIGSTLPVLPCDEVIVHIITVFLQHKLLGREQRGG